MPARVRTRLRAAVRRPARLTPEEAVAKLAAEGPPNEDVGLDPYGTYGHGEFAPPDTFVPPLPAPPASRPEGAR
ncbi:hypothetical protein ACFZB5_25930 [Streptomyces nodosus]|uniref:hypothetical protein n=1 Tax=Streptomyces nodosus TaxID=40318 RepID=UPI0036EBC863